MKKCEIRSILIAPERPEAVWCYVLNDNFSIFVIRVHGILRFYVFNVKFLEKRVSCEHVYQKVRKSLYFDSTRASVGALVLRFKQKFRSFTYTCMKETDICKCRKTEKPIKPVVFFKFESENV